MSKKTKRKQNVTASDTAVPEWGILDEPSHYELATDALASVKCLDQAHGDTWSLYQGDCAELIRAIPEDTIGYSIFSPPFASLYVYSASERDMGNARSHSEFTEHLRFLLREILRATMPGRLLSMHCMLLPTSKARDGIIGLTDFRGDLIRAAQAEGWAFHSEVTIWKDPVTAMQRTKAIGLLHKQLVKDSAMSRQGIPDYLCTFRKPGVNPEPVEKAQDKHWPDVTTRDSIELWQRYASPVWASSKGIDCEGFVEYCEPSNDTEDKRGIRATETLQYMSAREEKDERHICPLQLEVIQRGVRLWSNPGDVVLSPFAGIGSEGYIATRNGRRFVGFELKRSYYEQAVRNLRNARSQLGLFDTLEAS